MEGARVTALDLEDAWEAEAKLFAPAARVTGIAHTAGHHYLWFTFSSHI